MFVGDPLKAQKMPARSQPAAILRHLDGSPRRRPALACLAVLGIVALAGATDAAGRATAVFAGGCYWTMQHDMKGVPGVKVVTAGYVPFAPGDAAVVKIKGAPRAYESVQVSYDPDKISYGELVGRYLRMTNPMDGEGAFCDRGGNYRPAIFVADEAQRTAAQAAVATAQHELPKPIVTPVMALSAFREAPADQQDWASKHPTDYSRYRQACRKDEIVRAIWGARG